MKGLNKKGAMELIIIAIGVIVVAAILLISRSSIIPTVQFVGNTQINIIKAYDFNEGLQLFIDSAARQSVITANKELAETAGFYSGTEEGKIFECGAAVYPFLNKDEGIAGCVPDYETNFKKVFEAKLYEFLVEYQKVSLAELDFEITSTKTSRAFYLKIKALTNIEVPISSNGKYFSKQKGTSEETDKERDSDGSVPEITNADGEKFYSVKGIPNIICNEKDTSVGKICVTNKEILEQLKKISSEELVPKERTMTITQAYRTWEIQKKLFDNYNQNTKLACNPGYRSSPNICPHMTGGAIDVQIIEKDGTNLNKENPGEVLRIMCKYNFVNYKVEDWHFEYGTNQWLIAEERRKNGQEACSYG